MDTVTPRWPATILWLAAAYNLGFGAFAVLWPSGWFELGGMETEYTVTVELMQNYGRQQPQACTWKREAPGKRRQQQQ